LASRTYATARATTTGSGSAATAGTAGATARVTTGAAVGVGLLVLDRIFLIGGIGNGIFRIGRVGNYGVLIVTGI